MSVIPARTGVLNAAPQGAAIADSSTRIDVFACPKPNQGTQVSYDELEDPGPEPAVDLLTDGVAGWQIAGHVAPWGTTAQDPTQAIEVLVQVMLA